MMRATTTAAAVLVAAGACAPGGFEAGEPGGGGIEPGTSPVAIDAGIPTSGRITSGLQALYLFDEGTGTVIYDQSGVVPELDMTIETPASVSWVAEGGLDITGASSIQVADVSRLVSECRTANAITIEAWAQVDAADLGQTGPARLVDLSTGPNDTNFFIAQNQRLVEARIRTTDTLDDATPAIDSGVDAFNTRGIHIAVTRSGQDDQRTLYIDGTVVQSGTLAGSFDNWNTGADVALSLGNDASGNRAWRGQLNLVAVYCRALSEDEIARNYEEGF